MNFELNLRVLMIRKYPFSPLTQWKSHKIFPNLRRIQALEGVCGFLTYHDPLSDPEKAAAEHDYINAYSLGCTFFESVGIKILQLSE